MRGATQRPNSAGRQEDRIVQPCGHPEVKREDGEAMQSAEWRRIAVRGAAAKAAENMARKGSAAPVKSR